MGAVLLDKGGSGGRPKRVLPEPGVTSRGLGDVPPATGIDRFSRGTARVGGPERREARLPLVGSDCALGSRLLMLGVASDRLQLLRWLVSGVSEGEPCMRGGRLERTRKAHGETPTSC